ncbi:MAG: PAQR family membrane homeostasis protein TrhA [Candidatus Hinthialibacter sp.]
MNSITHGFGATGALFGLWFLVASAVQTDDVRNMICLSIYGFILFLFYTVSTLYHSLQGKPKSVFRKLDHILIYLLIAGTYIPFTLIALRGALGWFIFSAIWIMAIIGIVLDLTTKTPHRILPILLYLFMGWFILIALNPMVRILTPIGFSWLLAGGVFYTVGVIFYAYGKKVRHFHGIWHLFVLAGSISHYFTVIFFVI